MPEGLQQSVNSAIKRLDFIPKLPDHVPYAIGDGSSGVTSEPANSKQQTFFVTLTDKAHKHVIEIDESNFFDPLLKTTPITGHVKLSDGTSAACARFQSGAEALEWSQEGIEYRVISGLNSGSQPANPFYPDLSEQQLVNFANSFHG